MEYAATVTVNPLTALRMLQEFVKLNPGALLTRFIHACYSKQAEYLLVMAFNLHSQVMPLSRMVLPALSASA